MKQHYSKKIALVHDYLLRMGGGERVLRVLHEMFPGAPVYTVVYDENFARAFLPCAKIHGSYLQKLPRFLRHRYKYFSFLIPSAIERLDLSAFDIVISSCSAFCKGIITRPQTIHISYCHTPTRFLWDWTHEYSKSLGRKRLFGNVSRIVLHFLRFWDREAAKRVDYFIANSRHVAARIKKYYGRKAEVIYPPVDLQPAGKPAVNCQLSIVSCRKDFFLIVSQLRHYKRIDTAIEAFGKLGFPLVIVGEGNERKYLQRLARGYSNVQFADFQPDSELVWYYKNCKALIFCGEEDFGMVMVEAMSFGKPVLALRQGGAKEIILEGVTGEFFDDPHPVVLADGLRRLLANFKKYDPQVIRKRALEFSEDLFKENFLKFMHKCGIIET